ncbi:MAG: hypothetical protein JRG73_09215 [Deltaproteobacteria bacterium]|nr:hypothetical protein [Deltaproteobacteria bacterium]MBW2307101.1 hypothetical protein [Deltaproteobacteria bacterium]
MQAEAVLVPNESKKLIAKAVLDMDEVKKALDDGIMVMHPSSTTIFMYESILGRLPDEGQVWVCGVTLPRGLCGSRETLRGMAAHGDGFRDPLDFKHAWIFRKGQLQESMRLGDIVDQMSSDDVYVKGPNALDPQGNVGVLFANPAGGGGTIGRVIVAQRKRGFHLLLPIGLEKLIPVSIQAASKKAGFKNVDRAMGMPCGLIPVPGRKIDEVDAIRMISGAEATPIAAGGLGGAEGAVVLAIHGTEEQVNRAMEAMESVKGAPLPSLDLWQCDTCPGPTCHLRGRNDLPWLRG